MFIRPFADSDLSTLIELTIETFRPFYDVYVRALLGEEIFRHQHGEWEQDYRNDVPTLHDPAAGRHVAVGEVGGTIGGYVSWRFGEKSDHGQIYLLAVAAPYRGRGLGHELCGHAIEHMKADGVEVVEIGTGDDAFHGAARALYEDLGFTKIPIAGYLMKI